MKKYDPNDLSRAELVALGWRKWSRGLLLCPVSHLDKLRSGVALTSVTGRHVVVGRDEIDRDHRGGLSAFGIVKTGRTPASKRGRARGATSS